MDCALWLNRRKIRDAADIPRNLDIASLRGYFLAGSLVEWLQEHNGANYAEELEKIPEDCSDLNSRISEIFGGSAVDTPPVFENPLDGKTANSAIYTKLGSFTSFTSFGAGSNIWELLTKFGGSFGGSWNLFGSGFHEWEWEWLFKLYGFYGSFGFTSFSSFAESGGFEWLLQQFGYFGSFSSFGSFWNFPWESLGSYQGFPILDEYDLILFQTLMNCPLDRYGYGIHII